MRTQQLIMVNSCTSALTLALHMSDSNGGVIISTPMTCVATNTPIVNTGGRIAWADIDPKTGCTSVKDVERLLEAYPDTRAVMTVAWAGVPPDLEALDSLCTSSGINLILDAAHAMGATYKGRPIHEWADFTCYSLQAIKHVTSGDGGILVSRSKDDHDRAKALKWFGIDRDLAKDGAGNWKGQHWNFDIADAGYKFNMNNLSAAVGMSQLPYIDGLVETHRQNAELYTRLFRNSKHVQPLSPDYECEPSHWVYTVNTHPGVDRDILLQRLNDEGIGAGLVHVPNHIYSCFRSYERPVLGVMMFASRQLSLPVGWWLDEDDIRHIHSRVEALCSEVSS